MSFREIPTWTVDCDRCGHNADTESDFVSWTDKDTAQSQTVDADWLATDDGKHYCDECVVWDEERDERVPRPALAGGEETL